MNWIKTRDQLPEWLNQRGLTGCGVEIGVWVGNYAKHICQNWNGREYIGVDSWAECADWAPVNAEGQNEYLEKTLQNLKPWLVGVNPRASLYRMTSVEAATFFKSQGRTFDWVYIDANHKYEYVRDDIEAWFGLVRPGGLLAGHDYLHGLQSDGFDYGVGRAVDEFAASHNFSIVTTEDDPWPSWAIQL